MVKLWPALGTKMVDVEIAKFSIVGFMDKTVGTAELKILAEIGLVEPELL